LIKLAELAGVIGAKTSPAECASACRHTPSDGTSGAKVLQSPKLERLYLTEMSAGQPPLTKAKAKAGATGQATTFAATSELTWDHDSNTSSMALS
jgi:hypothetical protein